MANILTFANYVLFSLVEFIFRKLRGGSGGGGSASNEKLICRHFGAEDKLALPQQ